MLEGDLLKAFETDEPQADEEDDDADDVEDDA